MQSTGSIAIECSIAGFDIENDSITYTGTLTGSHSQTFERFNDGLDLEYRDSAACLGYSYTLTPATTHVMSVSLNSLTVPTAVDFELEILDSDLNPVTDAAILTKQTLQLTIPQ